MLFLYRLDIFLQKQFITLKGNQLEAPSYFLIQSIENYCLNSDNQSQTIL